MRWISIAFVGALAVAGCSKRRPATDDPTVSPWTRVGVGSVFVTHTVTRMQKPFEHVTETTTTQTLVGKDAAEAAVKIDITEGANTSSQDVKVPLRLAVAQAHDDARTTTTHEVCTVPAGTFQCERTTVEVVQGDTKRSTDTWTAKQFPVPVKSIVTNENMTISSELTSIKVAH